MSNPMEVSVDVSKIMADIKREIKEKGLYDELPAFEQVTILNNQEINALDATGLRNRIQGAKANTAVPADYPVEGNALKRLFKKASQKFTRCTIGPMSIRLTDNHAAILDCLEYACNVIEQQQAQIAEQNQKIAKIYAALDRGEDAE